MSSKDEGSGLQVIPFPERKPAKPHAELFVMLSQESEGVGRMSVRDELGLEIAFYRFVVLSIDCKDGDIVAPLAHVDMIGNGSKL